MHLAFLYLDKMERADDPTVYVEKHLHRHEFYKELKNASFEKISHVQRAKFNQSIKIDRIDYNFVMDDFDKKLRWWQEPAPALELLTKRKPDVVLVAGLDLPLNFRWLRRLTGIDVKIIGHHTGETIWPGRNLWLQQFGLRVVDAFIFHKKEDSRPWTKASVILSRQPVFVLPSFDNQGHQSVNQLKMICTDPG